MEPYVILTIILSLTLILLAFMAMFIEIGVEWLEGSKFPKINITFKKDTSLFDFLRPSRVKGGNKKETQTVKEAETAVKAEEESLDYIEKCLFGTAVIKYGEKAETVCTRETTIKAQKEGVDKYYYFNADSGAKIKCIDGFLNPHKGFQKIRTFDSWEGNSNGVLSLNMHRIALPISRMREEEERRLVYKIRVKINYQELQNNANRVAHGFYFRMHTKTHGAVLLFQIPNGECSEIDSFKLFTQYKDKTLYEKEIKNVENSLITLNKEYGNGWIRKGKVYTSVYWNIPSTLSKGQICELQWITVKEKGQ